MDNVYYVYEWYNIDTGEVFYIGKGKDSRYKSTNRRNKLFKEYYNAHNCKSRKLFEHLSEKDAFSKEKEIIKYYKENTNYKLTNLTDGGDGSSGLIVTEEYRNKMRNLVMGKNNPNYGHKWTKEMKQELRNKMIGRYDGENNPNYGNRWTKEQRERHNKAKKVICDGKEFITLTECAKYYGVKYTTMQGWINHKNNMPTKFKEMELRWK